MKRIDITLNERLDRHGNPLVSIEPEGEEKVFVSLEDYFSVFKESIVDTRTCYRKIGLFPPGTLSVHETNDERTFNILLHVPAKKRMIFFYDSRTNQLTSQNVALPNLVFFIRVVNGVAGGSLFATDTAHIKADTKLYLYPLGNVFGDGKVCMGSIVVENVACFTDAMRFVEAFFASETNNDLYTQSRTTLHMSSQQSLLNFLSEQETFSNSWLVETSMTISDLEREM